MIQLLERLGILTGRWATFLRVRRELESYSERELNDMGLSRADIGRIALEAATLAHRTAGTEEHRPAPLRQGYAPQPWA
jgi:uncharacterized protein YjiS (DUF1127 family)